MDVSSSPIQSVDDLLDGMPPRALFLAARPESSDLTEQLIARLGRSTEPLLLNYSEQKETPLMWAAHFNNAGYAKALAPHSNLCSSDRNGHTALCFAARNGSTEAALLLSRLAGPGFANINKTTPLMMAARGGSVETLRALLPSENPAACDLHGNNALMAALAESRLQTSLMLIPATPLGQRNATDYTALGIAAFRGLGEACEAILRQLHEQSPPKLALEQQVDAAIFEARKGGHEPLAIHLLEMSQALREAADLGSYIFTGASQLKTKAPRI